MSLVVIGLLPYLLEIGAIVAGPCIFMILLQYRDVILTFPQIVVAFGVGISIVLTIVLSYCYFGTPSKKQRLGKYVVSEEVGRGTFSRVLVAEKEGGIFPKLALKCTDCDALSDEQQQMVHRESEALHALQGHPNIVRCLDYFHISDSCICNQAYKESFNCFGCGGEGTMSDSQDGVTSCENSLVKDDSNVRTTRKTTEYSPGESTRRLHSRVRMGSEHKGRRRVNSRICLVMELLEGGTLDLEQIHNDGERREYFARDVVHTLLDIAAYMHQRNWVHRDIKPANLVFETNNADGRSFKLVDFAFAIRLKPDESVTSGCGSPGFMPPEVVRHHQWRQVGDVWAVGVIAYFLLYGEVPFGKDAPNTTQASHHARPNNNEDNSFSHCALVATMTGSKIPVSNEAQNFIAELLTIDPERRPTAKMALTLPWITAGQKSVRTRQRGDN